MDTELYAIQKRLKELGHDPGAIDGVWGPDTRRAVAVALGISLKAASKQPPSDAVQAPWFVLASAEIGTKETPGTSHNPDIVDYFQAAVGTTHPDEVPWCAAFVGAQLAQAGYKPSGSLMARSYLEWGTKIDKPRKGCVVVFKRGAAPAGHVGFVTDWSSSSIKCLGGNQGKPGAVTVASYSRASVLGFRWPSEAA
jgi:uncharacterized protein (TIGR02594 family)